MTIKQTFQVRLVYFLNQSMYGHHQQNPTLVKKSHVTGKIICSRLTFSEQK